MRKVTTSEFKERLETIYGDQFELLSEYVNNCTKVKLRCNKCGNIIYKRPAKMTGKEREGCYICSGKNHYKTKETLQKEVDKKYPKTYLILGDYVKAREPLLVKRIPCGHEYMISPDNLLRGKGCPKCGFRQSSFMDLTEEFLDSHSIYYIKEKIFDDCVNIRALPFDYYIPSSNTCIEVDGEFHYTKEDGGSSDVDSVKYKQCHKRDLIKTKYCKDNGINLIRLPFFEKDRFFEILEKELHVNTEITDEITQGSSAS